MKNKYHPWKDSMLKRSSYERHINNTMHEPYAADQPTLDIHATDPARLKLKKEIKKDLGIKDDPNKINNPRPDANPISGIQDSKDKYMEKKND